MILLTDVEIDDCQIEEFGLLEIFTNEHNIAKAQLKKVVEWLESPCVEHLGHSPRIHCHQCWNSLKEELDGNNEVS